MLFYEMVVEPSLSINFFSSTMEILLNYGFKANLLWELQSIMAINNEAHYRAK